MDGSATQQQPDIEAARALGRVISVRESVMGIVMERGEVRKNEVGFVCLGEQRLKSEVLRVRGNRADIQVFEQTSGVRVGDPVILTGELLSVSLGPGLLGQVYDGLQNPLSVMASEHGFFLPRGEDIPGLDPERKWSFTAVARQGDHVRAGDVLGTVHEGRFEHKIMAPFDMTESARVLWIQSGAFEVDEPIAQLTTEGGRDRTVTMTQRWPVRRPLPDFMARQGLVTRLYPDRPLTTTIRMIDTFFPIAEGGTACVPGPFGAGKTVLQGLISRYSTADIVIVVACGERAGEVVETITEFPQMEDPRTGGSLMDKTVIICNTSAMPVAAREASLYTGLTIGEYYRQMGYSTLLIADSTSRWAQAMRETSGRMEEIPGEEAFPAYLDSAIKGLYERAGVVETRHGRGALTMIGTVSPAGGNFEEPVTQSTLGTVKTFLGLSYDRAYKRFYPAIDPMISWSRYLDQLKGYFLRDVDPGWLDLVSRSRDLLKQGRGIDQMMQVTGEEGISLDDFVVLQKSILLDMVYLQQDAFDPVDISCPVTRQVRMLKLLDRILSKPMRFTDKDEARDWFTRITGLFRNLNYAAEGSPQFEDFLRQIETMIGPAEPAEKAA